MDLKAYKKIIVFGGSFDPPQLAHVQLPAMVLRAIRAQVVAYVPVARQPLKPEGPTASAEHRLEMLRLALADASHAVIWTDELDRAQDSSLYGPSYTVDTIERMRQQVGEKPEIRFLIGADQVHQFHKWYAWQRLIKMAEPIIMLRPPETQASLLASLPAQLDKEQWQRYFIDVPTVSTSSTQIRQRCAQKQSITGLVPPAVEKYIGDRGLYQSC